MSKKGLFHLLILISFCQIFSSTSLLEEHLCIEIINGKPGGLFDERIILKQDEGVLGFLCYKSIGMSSANIHSVYIYPEHRNHGFGSFLLTYVIAYLKGKGYKTIMLQPYPFELIDGFPMPIDDSSGLERLFSFYQSNGFKKHFLLKGWLYYGSPMPIIASSLLNSYRHFCTVAAPSLLVIVINNNHKKF